MQSTDTAYIADGTHTQQAGRNATQSADVDPYRILWLLWAERRFIARLAAVGLLGGVLIAILIPSRYTARTQLMPPDAAGTNMMGAMAAGMADKAGGLGTAAANLLGVKSSGALFVGILNSRTVQDRLVERFDLRRVYGVRYWYKAREKLASKTEISEDRKSGLITIEITDRSRDRAQQLAQAYVEELNRVASNSAIAAAGRERRFIEEQMAEVKKEMDASARALADFSTRHNTVDLKEQARAMVDTIAAAQGRLIEAQAELRGLQSIYTDNNVRVRSVQARINELKRQLRELGGSSGATKDRGGVDYPTLGQLPELGVTYEELYRQNRIANAVYEALVQQYEMSKIQEAKDTPKVQMLDVPELPEVKSFPPRILIIFGCGLLSIVFAGAWLVVEEQWAGIAEDNRGKLLVVEVARSVRRHPFWQNKGVLKARKVGVTCGRAVARLAPDRFKAKTTRDPQPVESD